MPKKLNVFVYYKEESKNGYEFEGILNNYWTFTLSEGVPLTKKVKANVLNQIKLQPSKSRKELVKLYEKQDIKFGKLKKIELVTLTKGKWIKGEYFAHEYSTEDQYGTHVPGKARKLTYSNGYTEYEVKCLDDTKYVMDGIWEEPDNNGCGDRFFADQPFLPDPPIHTRR